jgi:hypothetical protein
MAEYDFDHIMSEMNGFEGKEEDEEEGALVVSGNSRSKVEEISDKLERFMANERWKSVSKIAHKDGDVSYNVIFNVNKLSLRSTIIIESAPESIRIMVTLPAICLPEYSLIMDEFVAEFNYTKRYGALQHDARDGSIEYAYTFSFSEGFSVKEFRKYFDSCLFTAAEACPEVAKLSVGRLSKNKLAELNNKLNVLVLALRE